MLNMNPVYLRLLEIAEDQGEDPPIPGTYLQTLLSLSSGRISQISDPLSVAKIGHKGLSNLAMLGYNPKWVNEGPPNRKWLSPSSNTQSQSQSAEFDANVTSTPFGLRPIPVISYIQAGLLTDINDPYAPGDGFATEICEDDLGRFAFALEIEGESMLPEFRPGDRIIIDPDVSPTPGDFVVAKNGKQMATFKKYRPRGMNEQGEQVFELVPLNEDYPTMRSDIEHLRIIGTMVEHRKKYRRKA